MRPKLKTPPASLLAPGDVKSHARISFSDDDDVVRVYLDAAVQHLDGLSGILGRAIVTQVWTCPFQDWLPRMRLPLPDVASAVVKYRDESNVEQTVSSDLYEIYEDARSAVLSFRDAFLSPAVYADAEFPVTIEVTAGYGPASAVPWPLKVAVMMLAAHLYENREATTGETLAELPFGVAAMIAPYRRIGL